MSGTSLDGLDLAAVEFQFKNNKWDFELVHAETISYSDQWISRIDSAQNVSGEALARLNTDFGALLGEEVHSFISKTGFVPDLIASHGHTIFHQPDKGYTLQIGSGAAIAARTKITSISDFRSGDVALGGQGAPLVPIGDRLLFSDFDYCLNLGGFANISFERNKKRIAFDNCPVNFVLNAFAKKEGLPFDKGGELGKKGTIDPTLLQALNLLPYYKQKAPKSLGREWVETVFNPVLDRFSMSDCDKLRTVYEHIAMQISKDLSDKGKLLITGGGAFNTFLIERIKAHTKAEIIIPQADTINFKEAIIFAFLGVLRVKEINNCLASVTGAQRDNCGGVIHNF